MGRSSSNEQSERTLHLRSSGKSWNMRQLAAGFEFGVGSCKWPGNGQPRIRVCAAMVAEEQNEDMGSHTSRTIAMSDFSFTAKTEYTSTLPGTTPFNDHSPKVRKPYTMTKQREKWTEDEHQKFLEALKLYGRGWRKIEEHVGTKTAIQIRSHAQKFFSKVARESNDGTTWSPSVNSVEIPPPRPKKKPVHPYPRKSINSGRKAPVSHRSDSAAAKDTPSPRSVLSAAVSESDTSGPAASDDHNGCPSPNSCSTYEKANGFYDKPDMIPDWSCRNSSCLKLFGRTVMVTDVTPRSSSPPTREDSFNLPEEKVDETQESNQWSAQFQSPCVVEAPSSCHLQWCSYQGLPFVIFTPFNPRITEQSGTNSADTNALPQDSGKREAQKGFLPYKRCLEER